MREFLQDNHLWLFWASGLSLGLLILSVLLVPVVIARLPSDYFLQAQSRPMRSGRSRFLRWCWLCLRNLLGALLIALGCAMLVLPGQGVLTIFAGLLVMHFRAKRRLLQRALRRRSVQRSLNFVRKKTRKAPLLFEEQAQLGKASHRPAETDSA